METGDQLDSPGTLHTKDEKDFSKTVLIPGIGFHTPNDGSECIVVINLFLVENMNVESMELYNCNSDVVITIGQATSYVRYIIDKCLVTMKQNELCLLDAVIDVDTHTGKKAVELKLEILLKSFKRNLDCFEMNQKTKLDMSEKLKAIGTSLFKSGKTELAFQKFSRALKYLVLMGPQHSIENEHYMLWKSLKLACHLNLAACQLIVKNFDGVVQNCTKALCLEANNVKALYRRAQAFVGLKDYDSAQNDLLLAHQMEPQNTALTKLLKTVNILAKKENQRMEDAMKKMFS